MPKIYTSEENFGKQVNLPAIDDNVSSSSNSIEDINEELKI